jgi:hypothetical protein
MPVVPAVVNMSNKSLVLILQTTLYLCLTNQTLQDRTSSKFYAVKLALRSTMILACSHILQKKQAEIASPKVGPGGSN